MGVMEDDAKDFLIKVVKTLILAILWLLINTTIGIYMGWMFFQRTPTTGNYIFYIWVVGTLIALLFYFRGIWKDNQG
ncbi:MAG TPA: hypothetical protein VM012_04330 [Flavitalea sp.]|nr:hypothetical protein [Flavitalea sp.]